MGYHLEQTAGFSKGRESTLNVSDSVSYTLYCDAIAIAIADGLVTIYYYCTG